MDTLWVDGHVYTLTREVQIKIEHENWFYVMTTQLFQPITTGLSAALFYKATWWQCCRNDQDTA